MCFFLGGGASDDWYSNNIKATRERLSSAGIPEFNYSKDIDDFINRDKALKVKNQRLIISQVLARHAEEIVSVQGFPNFFDKSASKDSLPTNNGASWKAWDYEGD